MAFERIKLPYAMNALQPYISEETLQYHYDKHHKAYVEKLNALVKGTKFENASLEDVVLQSEGPIFNNGAQVWNHDFYWKSLTPNGKGVAVGNLAKAIDKQFGSFEEFRKKFTESATGLFGSGWTWLVQKEDGSLGIENTPNAENPMRKNQRPLLACDVWEHAYYIDYRNKRPDYLESFWKLANWDFAEEMFNK